MYRNRRGFTLAELLIVVAIIAVLVAIAIPVFNKQIEKSREAYDIATMRQAASAAIDLYYSGVYDKASAQAVGLAWWPGGSRANDNAAGAYDPSGKFYPSKNSVSAYGKGTSKNGGTSFVMGNETGAYAPDQDYTDAVVMVAIYPSANPARVDVFWKNKGNNNYVGGQQEKNVPKYSIRITIG